MDGTIKISHMIPAVVAVLVGLHVLLATKGTTSHRRFGSLWVLLMGFVAATGLLITGGPLAIYQGYGYIHLLSLFTLASLIFAVWAIRRGKVRTHAITMISTFAGLMIAGAFAMLMPDRILHDLMF